MDEALSVAARALASGDPLSALKRVALRDDAHALALRGTAMAQLGQLELARGLLRRAARAFTPQQAVLRARCTVAEAEVALAARDLTGLTRALSAAQRTLERHGDTHNATHARLIAARRCLVLGRIDEAERGLSGAPLRAASPLLVAIGELVSAELALRRIRAREARAALLRARRIAQRAGLAVLCDEIDQTLRALDAPAARVIAQGNVRSLDLEAVQHVLASNDLIVDGCARGVRAGAVRIALARRPVLFALARALAESWPGDVARDTLIARAFGARRVNDSHRARLRVELGRLRKLLHALAEIRATKTGFALHPRAARRVIALAPPVDGEDSAVRALLADGTAWSTSALALALGSSQRNVQRSLAALEAAGQVSSVGNARARRWLARSVAGFATTLLLPSWMPAKR